ncbi:ComEC/Rec2 family competence protein [Mongoliimonas terrestris]|uniref:ComEC/Rec2 family competence protein n=1 Tax=Mongoliimonas terrestris TaxID=1709001 RepID=UPI0009F8F0B7|nr:ComEC/Rec2 family competence protein [Mongoliimonas terrestris]
MSLRPFPRSTSRTPAGPPDAKPSVAPRRFARFSGSWRRPRATLGGRIQAGLAAAGRAVGAIRAGMRADLAAGRGFLALPVALAAGIGLWFFAPPLPLPLAIVLAGGAVAAAMVADRIGRPSLLLALLAAASTGWLATDLSVRRLDAPRLERPTSGVVLGHVETVEDRESRGVRTVIRVAGFDPPRRTPPPHRIRVTVRQADALKALAPGAAVRLAVRLEPPSPPLYPGGYDFARVAWFARIGGTGFAIGPPEPWPDAPPPPMAVAVMAKVQAFRARVAAHVRATLPGDTGAIAAALLVGDRGAIEPETDEAMRISGLSHVLSISGLHMSLVAFGLFNAIRFAAALVPPVALLLPVKRIAAAIALAGALGYLLVSGMSTATVRSAVMVAVALVAVMIHRRALSLRTVAVSALLIFVLDPVAVLDPGAQMSFASVAALIAAYEAWTARRPPRPPPDVSRIARAATALGAFVAASMASSLVAGLATGPIALHHFGRVAPLGVVANLLATPLVTLVIMPSGLLAALLMPFGLEAPALHLMGAGIDGMVAIADRVTAWTPGGGGFGRPALAGTLLMAAGGLWMIIWTAPARWLGLAPILAGLAVAPLEPRPDLVVSATGNRAMVALADGSLAVLGRADAFETGLWLAARGEALGTDDPRLTQGVRCDPDACVLAAPDPSDQTDDAPSAADAAPPGQRPTLVALVRRPVAFADECATARLVVTPLEAPAWCRKLTRVIDARDLAGQGARTYAIRPGTDQRGALRLTPLAASVSGPRRPWHLPPTEADRTDRQ